MTERHAGKIIISVLIYIIYIIIIPIIIFDMFLITQTIINPNKTPDFFGYKTFNIVTGSMEPTIKVDDIVVVKEEDKKNIKKNDIITFKIENEIITHRIIDIAYDNGTLIYTTKGDKNDVTDIEKVQFEQIEGKYVTKISKIGKIFTILKNKYIFSLILILLIICYLIQRKNIQKKKERKNKREAYERTKGECK